VTRALLDSIRTGLARMPPVMKVDITLQPLEVRLLGAQCEMARAHALARHDEEPCSSVQVVV
jgi:hypothetical protein